jgi:hypothetical protein
VDHLKQIGLALHAYHDANGLFPSSVGPVPAVSWRVAILPYLGHGELARQYNPGEPWDSANNRKLLEQMPAVYRDPRFQKKEDYGTETYFRGFAGEGGVLGAPYGMTLTSITCNSGAANTFAVVEAYDPVPWTEPEELYHGLGEPLPLLGGPTRGDFLALFCDAHVQRIPAQTDEKTLRCMIRWNNPTPFKLP